MTLENPKPDGSGPPATPEFSRTELTKSQSERWLDWLEAHGEAEGIVELTPGNLFKISVLRLKPSGL